MGDHGGMVPIPTGSDSWLRWMFYKNRKIYLEEAPVMTGVHAFTLLYLVLMVFYQIRYRSRIGRELRRKEEVRYEEVELEDVVTPFRHRKDTLGLVVERPEPS